MLYETEFHRMGLDFMPPGTDTESANAWFAKCDRIFSNGTNLEKVGKPFFEENPEMRTYRFAKLFSEIVTGIAEMRINNIPTLDAIAHMEGTVFAHCLGKLSRAESTYPKGMPLLVCISKKRKLRYELVLYVAFLLSVNRLKYRIESEENIVKLRRGIFKRIAKLLPISQVCTVSRFNRNMIEVCLGILANRDVA